MAKKSESNGQFEGLIGNGSLKIDVDISEALTGLKALQRETKKTIHILKELKEEQLISDNQVDDLIEELLVNKDGNIVTYLNRRGISVEFQNEGIRWKRNNNNEGSKGGSENG
ncbi:hypothetical protein WKH56_20745 [Priestia sp. SB1]|uniref:hypothetical protein n=1 Tax=Priestia sp. SB1 TaxID=3132359 RepID=UPI00316F4D93